MRVRTVLALFALCFGAASLAEAAKPKKPSVANYQKAMARARKNVNKRQKAVKLVNKGKVVRPAVRNPKKK